MDAFGRQQADTGASPSALPQPTESAVPQATPDDDMLEPIGSPETLDADVDPVKAGERPNSLDLDFVEVIIALVVIVACALLAHFVIIRWRRRRSARNAQYLPTSVPPGTNSLHPDHSFHQESAPQQLPHLYRPANPDAI